MPNYIYKCTKCYLKEIVEFPISSDPKLKLGCPVCLEGRTMTRRIGTPSFPKNCNKVFAGDWFKKTYGHDIGETYEDKARQADDRKTLEREYRKQHDNDNEI